MGNVIQVLSAVLCVGLVGCSSVDESLVKGAEHAGDMQTHRARTAVVTPLQYSLQDCANIRPQGATVVNGSRLLGTLNGLGGWVTSRPAACGLVPEDGRGRQ